MEHTHHRTEEVMVKLRAAIEHLEFVRKMLAEQKSCTDVVEQLAGVQTRITECQQIVVKDHITSCITPALKPGSESALKDVEVILQQLMKLKIPQGSHH